MGKELNKEHYNKIFKNSNIYSSEAKELKYYYETWKTAYSFIINNKIKDIIDLGCGPGHFPSIFEENKDINYTGIDFSDIAISQALSKKYKSGNKIDFIIEDLLNYKPSKCNNFFTSFEFLEHISFDLEILSSLSKDSEILFSVPNFDSDGHVRYFNSESEVENRYNNILDLSLLNVKIFKDNYKIYLYYGIRK